MLSVRLIKCLACGHDKGITIHHNGKLVECLSCSKVCHYEDNDIPTYKISTYQKPRFEYKPKNKER